ncbi:MAG: hypothetical protein N2169_06150 [bacterium]|nr:hypothetical protein [bacterium]
MKTNFLFLQVLIILSLLFKFCLASNLRIGYEIDMRTKTISTRQNLFIDYKFSEKYRIRLIFNDIDLDKDLFKDKTDIRARLYYLPSKDEQFFFTLGNNFKNLGYSKKFGNYELELVLAKRQKLDIDTAVRLHLSNSFSIKFGFINTLSKKREFYVRPRLIFFIK